MAHILGDLKEAWEKAVPFQVEDAEFTAKNGSGVLGHKTGLGKTFISQLTWSRWQNCNKALICGTLSSCATWSRLLRRWSGVQPVFMQGKDDPSWKQFLAVKEGVYMCTYSTYLWLMRSVVKGKVGLDLLINDELHKTMRHRNKTWEQFKRMEFEHYLGLSATWASRGPQDLYPVLNLMNHRFFPSYWAFVNTWCHVEKSHFGTQIYGVKNEANLRKMLWGKFYVGRTWPEVGHQFRNNPSGDNSSEPVIRRAERIEMGKQQIKIIQELDRELVVMLGDDLLVTPNSLSLLTRKLQLAISPRILLPSAEVGGPVEWLVDKIAEDPHTVVFCPFREGLEVVKQELISEGRDPADLFTLWGGIHPDEVNKIVAEWKKRKGVIFCTVSFAQSFDLDTTDNAYMLGFDWDPNNNEQAEGRLRRFDTILQAPCNVTYIVPEHSDYEQVVIPVLDGKIVSTRGYLQGYKKGRGIMDLSKLSEEP